MKKQIAITLEEQLLTDIEKIRGITPRSTFINNFLKKHLNLQTAKELLIGGLE